MGPNGLDQIYFDITVRLVGSLLIGGLIGLERSYHGRPAGFRTHSLVCLSVRFCSRSDHAGGRNMPIVEGSRLYTNDRANAGKLTQALNRIDSIKEYRISPTGD
jgi:hypothetical protein